MSFSRLRPLSCLALILGPGLAFAQQPTADPAGHREEIPQHPRGTAGRLTNEDVIKMVQAGLRPPIIIATIETQPCSFDLTPDRIVALRDSGVSEEIIAAMVAPSSGAATGLDKPVALAPAKTLDCNQALQQYRTAQGEADVARAAELARAVCEAQGVHDAVPAEAATSPQPRVAPRQSIDVHSLVRLSQQLNDQQLLAAINDPTVGIAITPTQLDSITNAFSPYVIHALRARISASGAARPISTVVVDEPYLTPVLRSENPTIPIVLSAGQQLPLDKLTLYTTFTAKNKKHSSLSESVKQVGIRTAERRLGYYALSKGFEGLVRTVGFKNAPHIILAAGDVFGGRSGKHSKPQEAFQMYFVDGVSSQRAVQATARFYFPHQFVYGYELQLVKFEVRPNENARLMEARHIKATTLDQFGRQTQKIEALESQITTVLFQSQSDTAGITVWTDQPLEPGEYAFALKKNGTNPAEYADHIFDFRAP